MLCAEMFTPLLCRYETGRASDALLAVDVLAVPNLKHLHGVGRIFDFADQSITANAVFPVLAIAPLERFADAAGIRHHTGFDKQQNASLDWSI